MLMRISHLRLDSSDLAARSSKRCQIFHALCMLHNTVGSELNCLASPFPLPHPTQSQIYTFKDDLLLYFIILIGSECIAESPTKPQHLYSPIPIK